MPTIAFEGRHCSGQREPGRLVAKELGFDFVDRIMLAEIAKKVGSTVEAVSMRKLKKPSMIDMFAKGINQILNNSPAVGVGGDPYFGPGIENEMSKEFYELDETIIKNPEDVDYNRMIEATKEVIKDISDLGKLLVISRGASAILKEKDNVLRVFFIANEVDRITRAKSMHNLENEIEEIRWIQDRYIETLVAETDMTKRMVKKLLDKKVNIYLDAEQAVDYGIADIIVWGLKWQTGKS